MLKIAPSILSADFGNLLSQVKAVEAAGAEYLHIDVMDGHFVPNITLGPLVVEALKGKVDMVFDVHLMIQNPDLYVADFAKAGADIITVHAEASTHLHRSIQKIKELGKKAGVALNPATPLNVLEYVLDDLDMVLIMSVNPGFGGQGFINQVLPKIKDLRQLLNERNPGVEIEVDGGINPSTAPLVVQAGANVLVAGSAVFKADDIQRAVTAIRQAGK